MKENLKYFLIGAILTSVPMSFYAYFKLKPVTTSQAQLDQTKYLASNQFLHSLELKIPSPTITPKSKATSNPIINVQAQTASYVQTSVIPEDVKALIERYTTEYRVNKDMMTHIALCESGFRSNAVNGPYAGIYQFVSATWISNRRAMGLDADPALRFNAEESVKTAAFKMARDGFGAWPVCQQRARNILSLNK